MDMEKSWSIALESIAIVSVLSAIVYGAIYGLLRFYQDYRERRIIEYENFQKSFDNLVY